MNLWELGLLDHIHAWCASPLLDTLMPIITLFGENGIFWIVASLIFLLIPKTRKMGMTMGLALLIGLILGNGVLKNVVGRIRPYDLNRDFPLLVKHLSDYSFPSGHTLASFECAVAMLCHDKRFGIPAMVLAVLVALSRLYLYVHYPTDVLAGAILGTIFALIAAAAINAVYRHWGEKNRFLGGWPWADPR